MIRIGATQLSMATAKPVIITVATPVLLASLNGRSASVLEVDGIIILERQERTPGAIKCTYKELDRAQLAEIKTIEYDPYNDALYARTLLDFADAILDD